LYNQEEEEEEEYQTPLHGKTSKPDHTPDTCLPMCVGTLIGVLGLVIPLVMRQPYLSRKVWKVEIHTYE
jgi:hypothetical protein